MVVKAKETLHPRRSVVFQLPTRTSYLAAYFHQGDLGAVFVPGESDLAAGERVELLVRFTSEAREFRARGTVRWKRKVSGVTLPAGIAVEFAPSERATRDLLLEFARGKEVRWSERKDPRLPVSLEIQYATDSALLTDYTDDLSNGGAFIRCDEDFPIGTELSVKLHPPGDLFSLRLKARVAWKENSSDRRGLGVRFVFDNPRVEQRFRKLIEKLRARLDAALEVHTPQGRT